MSDLSGVRIAVDRGGTFCDLFAYIPQWMYRPPPPSLIGDATIILPEQDDEDQGAQVQMKLLSVDPANYQDAPAEGIRRIMQIVQGKEIRKGVKIDTTGVDSVRMGTTVATNALLERKGARFGLIMTKGFADLLEMGDHTRPDLFDIKILGKPSLLYERADIVEADERVTIEGYSYDPIFKSAEELVQSSVQAGEKGKVVVGLSGEAARIIKPLDEEKLEADLSNLYEKGVRGIAVCLLHSYTYPEHEKRISQIATRLGFTQISLSSSLSATPKAVPRGHSAAMDAYVSPVLSEYIQSFLSNFEGGRAGKRCDFMKSDGGLVSASKFTGLRALLSGPAGGVVGCALTAYSKSSQKPVIGFDMGGTSTDVCRYNGVLETTYESMTAGQKVAVPQLSIETVASGGGSRLTYKNGLFQVGPESVSAHPGPACYRKGGELAITDANLVLGRLVPSEFPSVFGPNADQPLDAESSLRKFKDLATEINKDLPAESRYTVDQVAAGYIKVANEAMSRPMRTVTQQRGYLPSAHDLCCFGGAGGQHACAIAKGLGIETVIVPKFSSILSAYGIACADITSEAKEPFVGSLSKGDIESRMKVRITELEQQVLASLAEQEVDSCNALLEVYLGCHYDGSDTIFQVPISDNVEQDFIDMHFKETSFSMDRNVMVASLMVAGTGKSKGSGLRNPDFAPELQKARLNGEIAYPFKEVSAYFDYETGGRRSDVPVYKLSDAPVRSHILGPAILVDRTQTIVVEPNSTAIVLKRHVVLDVRTNNPLQGEENVSSADPVALAVFANRFMSIAEQMGVLFERTSISLSIKERLDFSCSIHNGEDGGLVCNAPHIPIHLGSMADAVRYQHKAWLGRLKPGDVLLTNHPDTGGTHLPDLTVVTPIFDPADTTRVLFYVASRGHHSDIGGSGVTSMNPVAKELWEEGIAVKTFKLVSQGVFHEEGIKALFAEAGEHPGCSATRRIDHNITDLQAAISANVRGASLMQSLFDEFGSKKVLFYMREIQVLASKTIRSFLQETYDRFDGRPLIAEDHFDDGTVLKLKITIERGTGAAVFDWTGTGMQSHSNCNVPISISYASIIYCLRAMIKPDVPMPLNQGVLDPITNIVPEGSILNPTGGVAVSASTIASQRLVDVILKAFEAAAASQGCANSLGFGTGGKDVYGKVTPGFAYGEAFGGGAGAGHGWNGAHSVSVHSTNTKLTDVEVIESRTPLLLKEFGIRKGSGGEGKWKGGDGCYRHFIAMTDLNASIVSQRRVYAPFGMKGGGSGKRGENLLIRKRDGKDIAIGLGHNGMARLHKGDEVRIESPGGGGWGTRN